MDKDKESKNNDAPSQTNISPNSALICFTIYQPHHNAIQSCLVAFVTVTNIFDVRNIVD